MPCSRSNLLPSSLEILLVLFGVVPSTKVMAYSARNFLNDHGHVPGFLSQIDLIMSSPTYYNITSFRL